MIKISRSTFNDKSMENANNLLYYIINLFNNLKPGHIQYFGKTTNKTRTG